MDVLKREMERKRREREELAGKAGLTTTGAKFLRQADVLAREEELRREKQLALDQQRRRMEGRSEGMGEHGESSTRDSVDGKEEDVRGIEEEKGESERGSDKRDGAELTELRSEASDASPTNKRRRMSREGSVTSDHEDKESRNGQETRNNLLKLPEGYKFSSDSSLSPETVIRKYLKTLLQQWEIDLEQRDVAIKNSAQGKVETRTLKQCRDYIKPLFKLCKRKEVPADIKQKLMAIVRNCEEGNFRYVIITSIC